MTEYTTYECDLTGRRARNRNVMEELPVVHSSGSWEEPEERTYHIHLEEAFEKAEEMDKPTLDAEPTMVFVEKYCYEDGEVVGAIGMQNRELGRPTGEQETMFVGRDELHDYYEYMASLIEDLENHD
jgi:hypothetical protein